MGISKLEEAINRLKGIVEISNTGEFRYHITTYQDAEAIDTVLKELDNRIPKEDIEKELQELEVPILCWGGRGNGKTYARAVKEAKKYLLRKLLNKE